MKTFNASEIVELIAWAQEAGVSIFPHNQKWRCGVEGMLIDELGSGDTILQAIHSARLLAADRAGEGGA